MRGGGTELVGLHDLPVVDRVRDVDVVVVRHLPGLRLLLLIGGGFARCTSGTTGLRFAFRSAFDSDVALLLHLIII